MNKEVQHKHFFHLTSTITDYFPEAGSRILDLSIRNILGNKILSKFLSQQAKHRIEKIKRFNRFLIVSDLNIGDAIICSSGVAALRKIFPQAEIDFVIKKSTKNLIEGNPDISNLYPIYIGSPYPVESDLYRLANLAGSKEYDLIINFSPMIDDKIFGKKRVINYFLMVAELVRNEKFKNSVNNISYQAYHFIKNLFGSLLPAESEDKFIGPKVYLSDDAIKSAENFLLSHGISLDSPLIMLNPDTTAKFTRIPFNIQIELLSRLSEFQCTILLGAGQIETEIEQKLLNSLSPGIREKIVIVPVSFKLDTYTALIDLVDIFITGDTGPLHLAAARKFSKNKKNSLRNKTAIFSIFGSTPARMYGFDSKTPGFFAANQDAPSRAFIAESPCRNITCINKLAKTCSEVRCFQSLDIDEIISESAKHLESTGKYLANANAVTRAIEN
ncbi:MAG: glycosyltransferase family 9 protein [Ignavibacteriaceae bacterium]